jgi:VCBS repeat-containing protein
VTVNSVNDDPTLTAINDVTAEVGTSFSAVIATGSDLETAAGSLTYTATSDNQAVIADAGLVFTNNSLQITPVAATTGIANITVRVTDADGGFAEQVFTVTIDSAPTIGVIADQTINVNSTTGALLFTVGDTETAAENLTLSATSSDLTLVPLNNISFGGSGANRAVTVSPAAGLTGSSTIRVTVTDASGLTAFEQFTVTVNALPTISTIADINRDEDAPIQPFDITIGDAETAADNLIVTISSNNQALFANGSLSVSTMGATRTVTMAQVPNASGTAIITVTVDDGDGGITTETFTVSIAAIEEAPTAGAAAGIALEGGSVVIDLGAVSNDPEGALNLATGILITNQPANGSVAVNGNGTVTYTHNGSETLTDSFTYTIADALGNVSNEATVSVTITPVNDGPDAVNDTATATIVVGSMDPVVITGNLLGNDTDSDTAAASLFVSALSQGAIGTPIQLTYGDLTINADGSWTYTVDDVAAILAATDPEELLTYTLSDGDLTDLATLTIDFNITP